MKRKVSKILAIVVVLALAMSVAAISAFAVEYTPVTGEQRTFKKQFVVPATANVPDVDFEFTIAPGTAVPLGTDNEIEILAGIVVTDDTTGEITAPTIGKAEFDGNSPTSADPTDSSKKIATDNVTFDFSGITFTQPGVYRYVITEQPNAYNGIKNDENATRYLDVFVFPSAQDASALEITTYSMRTVEQKSNFTKVYVEGQNGEEGTWKYQYEEEPGDKSDGYENELETVDLELSKKITGNQADMNKKFKYTLVLEDVNPGTYKVEVDGTDVVVTDATSEDYSNVQADAETGAYTITVDESGEYTCYFYLTNGEKVTVKDLNKGYAYTVSEAAEDYVSTQGIDNEGTENDYLDALTNSNVIAPLTKVGFTNTRTGVIPTGVIITVAPFAIGILVFGAIMLYVVNRRRRAVY